MGCVTIYLHGCFAQKISEELEGSHAWFTQMRELVGERPNIKPTGIGNSQSEPGEFEDILNGAKGKGKARAMDVFEMSESDVELADADDEDADKGADTPSRTVNPPASGKGRRAPRSNTSTPAQAPSETKTKGKSVGDRFADAVKDEEITRQEALKTKRAAVDVEKAKVETKAAVLTKQMEGRLELARLKAQQKHDRAMAKIRMQGMQMSMQAMGMAASASNTFAGGRAFIFLQA
jgi:hypothetical protein